MAIDPVLYWATLLQCLICSIGFAFNGFLVFVIIKNKKLRTSCCSLFILAMAIFDCLAEFSLISLPTFLTVSGITISLQSCFFAESYGPFAQMNMQNLLFLISLDRFFSIIFPIHYKFLSTKHKNQYFFGVIASSAFGTIFVTLFPYYNYSMDDANKSRQVYCMPSDLMGPSGLYYGLILMLIQNIGTVLVYISLWLLIRFKVVNLMQDKVDRRVLRSLYVLMLVTFICWFPSPLFGNFVLPYLPISPILQNAFYRAIQQMSKIGQAANAPILYFCSSDYRNSMQKEFENIFNRKFIRNENRQTTSNVPENKIQRTIVNNFIANSI